MEINLSKPMMLIVLLCSLTVNLCLACAPEKIEPNPPGNLYQGCSCLGSPTGNCVGVMWEEWAWECKGDCSSECETCVNNGTEQGIIGDIYSCGFLVLGIPVTLCSGGCGFYYCGPMTGNLPVCECVSS